MNCLLPTGFFSRHFGRPQNEVIPALDGDFNQLTHLSATEKRNPDADLDSPVAAGLGSKIRHLGN
jgi:hypothetical protein